MLMAFSNRYNHLLLTTGNKSELAVGYCTLYGDMCGGLAVISDVPKTTVWELSRWINQHAGPRGHPAEQHRQGARRPSCGRTRPTRTRCRRTTCSTRSCSATSRRRKAPREIIAEGFDAATVTRVIKMTDRSEYKRRQAAPGLKVTSRAFGFGRRMPIAQNYEPAVAQARRAGARTRRREARQGVALSALDVRMATLGR